MREADNLTTFTCRMSWKSGSLNLLEPSGPYRACYGTALCLIQNDSCSWSNVFLQPTLDALYVCSEPTGLSDLVLMICDDLESFCRLHNLLPALTHFHRDWYAYLYVLFCFRWAVCRAVESSGWNMWVVFSRAVHLEQKGRGIYGVFAFVYRCRESRGCIILL